MHRHHVLGSYMLGNDQCVLLQEASLREFCERPENKHIIDREQSKQAERILQLKQQHEAMQFKNKVFF